MIYLKANNLLYDKSCCRTSTQNFKKFRFREQQKSHIVILEY